jgi:hypothetical protein
VNKANTGRAAREWGRYVAALRTGDESKARAGGAVVNWRVVVRLYAGAVETWEAPESLSRSEAGDWARDLLWPDAAREPRGTVQTVLPAGVSGAKVARFAPSSQRRIRAPRGFVLDLLSASARLIDMKTVAYTKMIQSDIAGAPDEERRVAVAGAAAELRAVDPTGSGTAAQRNRAALAGRNPMSARERNQALVGRRVGS